MGENLTEVKDPLLRPLDHSSKVFYVFIVVLLILMVWFGYAYLFQLAEGLGVTAMRTPVGVAWGLYISNFIFFVCIAHGGVAIAAAIRIMKLEKYKPIARIGEVLTVISLMMAGLAIVIDMGRPDRVFNIIIYYWQRLGESPLTWDITVVFSYFILSTSFLWLTIRKDLSICADKFRKRRWLYKPLLLGYRPDDEHKIERIAWWSSVAIVCLIVLLSGGVVPWIFGLLPSRPGWFGALAGPYFLTAAIASSMATVIVAATVLRRLFGWEEYIKRDIIKGLGNFLGVVTLFYLYLMLAEQLTMSYAGPHAESLISEILMQEGFALLFWFTTLVGFLIPSLILIAQAIYPRLFTVTGTFLVAILILVGFWIKRVLIVVPSLLHPLLPFTIGSYEPSWVEWSLILGLFATAVFLYTLFVKLFPIMELRDELGGGQQ